MPYLKREVEEDSQGFFFLIARLEEENLACGIAAKSKKLNHKTMLLFFSEG